MRPADPGGPPKHRGKATTRATSPAPTSGKEWLAVAGALTVAGWGANQFTPLAVVYRTQEQWEPVPVAAMFTIYLVGLVPGLLLGCPLADRYGRRRLVRLALAVTAVASALLATAGVSDLAVYASRLATGLAAGVILSAGGTWLQELSAAAGRDSAGRRAMYATGAGFAVGPLVAGVAVEWLPHALVLPCLVHSFVAVVVLVATIRVSETLQQIPSEPVNTQRAGPRWAAVSNPRFIGVVLPASPAVFAAATVAYVVLPPLVIDAVRDYAPLFAGLVAAVTITVGLAVQPLAEWLDHAGSARSTLVAMATVVVGMLVGAVAVERVSPLLVLADAVILGAGYGLILASGLREIERLASPSAQPTALAFYQGIAHSGFLTPLLLAVTAGSASYPALLVGLATVGLLFLGLTAVYSRRHLPPDDGGPDPAAIGHRNYTEENLPWAE